MVSILASTSKWWPVCKREETTLSTMKSILYSSSYIIGSTPTWSTLSTCNNRTILVSPTSNKSRCHSRDTSSKSSNLLHHSTSLLSKTLCSNLTRLLKFAQLSRPSDGDWPRQEERGLWSRWFTLTCITICWTARTKQVKTRTRLLINCFCRVIDVFLNTPWRLSTRWVTSAWVEVTFFKKVILWKLLLPS